MNNYRLYARIDTVIGEVRINRACAIKNAICYTICGGLIGAYTIYNPSSSLYMILGGDFIVTTIYGVKSYLYTKDLTYLNKEKAKIKEKSYI